MAILLLMVITWRLDDGGEEERWLTDLRLTLSQVKLWLIGCVNSDHATLPVDGPRSDCVGREGQALLEDHWGARRRGGRGAESVFWEYGGHWFNSVKYFVFDKPFYCWTVLHKYRRSRLQWHQLLWHRIGPYGYKATFLLSNFQSYNNI